MWKSVRKFIRSPLGKRLIGVLLATMGISVTFNQAVFTDSPVGVTLVREQS